MSVLYAELPKNESRRANFKSNRFLKEPQKYSIIFEAMRGLDLCALPAAKYAEFSSQFCRHGEMAYTVDSKSAAREGVWVQVPLPANLAPKKALFCPCKSDVFSIIALDRQ
jgi:hypothetical protein